MFHFTDQNSRGAVYIWMIGGTLSLLCVFIQKLRVVRQCWRVFFGQFPFNCFYNRLVFSVGNFQKLMLFQKKFTEGLGREKSYLLALQSLPPEPILQHHADSCS